LVLDQLAAALLASFVVRKAVSERSILVRIVHQVLAAIHLSRSAAVEGPGHLHLARKSLAFELGHWKGGTKGHVRGVFSWGFVFSQGHTHTYTHPTTREKPEQERIRTVAVIRGDTVVGDKTRSVNWVVGINGQSIVGMIHDIDDAGLFGLGVLDGGAKENKSKGGSD